MYTEEQLKRHIKTHTERSADDTNAVTTLEFFLRSDAKINCTFSKNDKWPNIDGTFELVPNPEETRRPKQNFIVQIKGTTTVRVTPNGTVKYQLKSLAFPAYIALEVSLDPGILFVVVNPKQRDEERVFWKYLSASFLSSINFEQDSVTIEFTSDDEIKNTDISIESLVKKLDYIANTHSLMKQLENRPYKKTDIISIIKRRCQNISEAIENGEILHQSRDKISSKILTELYDLCKATLLLNATHDQESVTLRIAWETALLNIESKFLASFYRGLQYIGLRVPEDGQNERLMIKYFDFLWKTRKYLEEKHQIFTLQNLEDFPQEQPSEDEEFNRLVAEAIEKVSGMHCRPESRRYYIQHKKHFYIGKERYFEITLQLADKYATKYNRITVYSKTDISTNYSIQIGYVESTVYFWENPSIIRIVTDWRVSILPKAMNILAKMIRCTTNLNSQYNEYEALMAFLTKTGMDLLDFIDMRDERFCALLDLIYSESRTKQYQDVLLRLHRFFSNKAPIVLGRYTVRYTMIRLREELLEEILPDGNNNALSSEYVYISKGCYGFERKPALYDLLHNKTNGNSISRDVVRAAGRNTIKDYLPYIRLKHSIEKTGELFFPQAEIENPSASQTIQKFNSCLTSKDREKGFLLKSENGLVYIDQYLRNTTFILQRLLDASRKGNDGQGSLNLKFLQSFNHSEVDKRKIDALQKVFVQSKLLAIYGAAGTGKTTLMNYISALMESQSKLFLAKTHTAKENLMRRITQRGVKCDFMVLDSYLRYKNVENYDVVFVDECSAIDNRAMVSFLQKIAPDTLLVLAGDVYQLESIDFGNWFYYAKEILPECAFVELDNNWRTKDEHLKALWDEVRFFFNYYDSLITERLVIDGPFSKNIGNEIFTRYADDEIILCLNYDGKFGLNSMNSYLQDANPSKEIYTWSDWKYKVGDPILFNDCARFPMLYNNLKGRIVGIEKHVNSIHFTVDVPIVLTAISVRGSDLIRIDGTDEYTRVRIDVFSTESGMDEDNEEARIRSVVPFQLAYAVSIHKAQGLEYDSVKVIIPRSISERITHGVFYTAITRAKRLLKIYWNSDTMKQVISSFGTVEGKPLVSMDLIKQHLQTD